LKTGTLLSSISLTTFVVKPGLLEPILIQSGITEKNQKPSKFLSQLNQLQCFEEWVKEWNNLYSDYRVQKNSAGDLVSHPWRGEFQFNHAANSESLNADMTSISKSQISNISHMQIRLLELARILRIDDVMRNLEGIENLILIPHRDLHVFPLHALFELQPVCNIKSFTYLPSASYGVHGAPKAVEPLNRSLLSVNPDTQGLDALPLAAFEAMKICEMTKSFSLDGSQASQFSFKKALQQYSFCHFTGHAKYSFEDPLKSTLALSGDDNLTVDDIFRMIRQNPAVLKHSELISLSACETALTGSQTITDEYIGLVSAFLKAGASQVVSTLWIIPEGSSALLMIEFYRQVLQESKPKAVALQNAKQWLRSQTREQLITQYENEAGLGTIDPRLRCFLLAEAERFKRSTVRDQDTNEAPLHQDCPYAAPYYWAAFIITGIS
jgi:CHAT domain-containing protein